MRAWLFHSTGSPWLPQRGYGRSAKEGGGGGTGRTRNSTYTSATAKLPTLDVGPPLADGRTVGLPVVRLNCGYHPAEQWFSQSDLFDDACRNINSNATLCRRALRIPRAAYPVSAKNIGTRRVVITFARRYRLRRGRARVIHAAGTNARTTLILRVLDISGL